MTYRYKEKVILGVVGTIFGLKLLEVSVIWKYLWIQKMCPKISNIVHCLPNSFYFVTDNNSVILIFTLD